MIKLVSVGHDDHKGENNFSLTYFRCKEVLHGCGFGLVKLFFNFRRVVTPIDKIILIFLATFFKLF